MISECPVVEEDWDKLFGDPFNANAWFDVLVTKNSNDVDLARLDWL